MADENDEENDENEVDVLMLDEDEELDDSSDA